jgi:hypothetical protein
MRHDLSRQPGLLRHQKEGLWGIPEAAPRILKQKGVAEDSLPPNDIPKILRGYR